MAKQVAIGLTMLGQYPPPQHVTGLFYSGIDDPTVLEAILADAEVSPLFARFIDTFARKALEYGLKQQAEKQPQAETTRATR